MRWLKTLFPHCGIVEVGPEDFRARPSDRAGRATPRADEESSRPSGDHPSRGTAPNGEYPDSDPWLAEMARRANRVPRDPLLLFAADKPFHRVRKLQDD